MTERSTPLMPGREKLQWLGMENQRRRESPWQNIINEMKEVWNWNDQSAEFETAVSSYGDYGELGTRLIDDSDTVKDAREVSGGDLSWPNFRDNGLIPKYKPYNFGNLFAPSRGTEAPNAESSSEETKRPNAPLLLKNRNPERGDETAIRSGFTSESASWAAFKYEVIYNYENWSDFENSWRGATTVSSDLKSDPNKQSGASRAGGVRVHEERGTTRDGARVPAGTVEIFGPEVHFSKTGNTGYQAGSGEFGSASRPVSGLQGGNEDGGIRFESFSASSNQAPVGSSVTFNAEIINYDKTEQGIVLSLTKDGEVVTRKHLTSYGDGEPLDSGENREVTLTYTSNDTGEFQFRLGPVAPVEVTWVAQGAGVNL